MSGGVLRRVGVATAGAAAAAGAVGYAAVNGYVDVYKWGGGYALQWLDPESAHHATIRALRVGLVPYQRDRDAADWSALRTTLFERTIPNPIGLAAGFDKDGEAIDGCFKLGFGLVEVGSVTPKPQPGNPTPRVFRLPADRAVINRYGFNSCGLDGFERNVRRELTLAAAGKSDERGLVGINLGKNLSTEPANAALDYAAGARRLSAYADYIVVNVSSPNTPGLRNLQGKEQLRAVLLAVLRARDEAIAEQGVNATSPPLLVKIAPDVGADDRRDIAEVVMELKLDGIIVGNTTISRPASLQADAEIIAEKGGLSGAPLFELSTAVLYDMYRLTEGKVTLIGCGGVSSGRDVYEKIRAGASAVQLYTALVYEGPTLITRMRNELVKCLDEDGYKNVAEAVGAAHRRGNTGDGVANRTSHSR